MIVLPQELLDSWAFEEGGLYTSGLVTHRYFTRAMGGLVPPAIPIEDGWFVLDANCGYGSWILDLLKLYPNCQITGIDGTESMIQEARRLTSLRGLLSPNFQVMNISQIPHVFHNKPFDMIYMRNASARIQTDTWPAMITALVQALRPGGWINLVEYEPGPTSSEAFNQLVAYAVQVFHRSRRAFPLATSGLGVATRLYGFLQHSQIPLLDISYTIHAVEVGLDNNQDSRAFLEAMLALVGSIKPLVQRSGLTSARVFDQLMKQANEELFHPYTCGYGTLFSVVGCREK